MAVNQILNFAYLVNANIMALAEYQAASWRPGGFVQGVAISPHLNRVWHQSSFMAASLGEFIMNSTGQDVLDDNDVAGMANRIANAIRAVGGGGGASGIPDAPGMDSIIYGLQNQRWVAVPGGITLGDVQALLAGYLPLTGGQMLVGGAGQGWITLARAPEQPMHAVTLAYVEQRISDIVAGQGGMEDAPNTSLTYGRQGNPRGWRPVVRADEFSVIDPGPLRIRSNLNANGISPALELENSSVGIGSVWRTNVGNQGNWHLQHWDVGTGGWETELSAGYVSKGIFAPRGGFITGVGIGPEYDRAMPGSLQAYATVTQNYPTSQDYPELILGNLGTIAGPYSETYPRYGKWRLCVGAGGNLNFHHNTSWDNWGDFSTCEGVLSIRHGAAAVGVEVFGTLQVDNDFILGRNTVPDAWITRPNELPPGWKNLYFGTTGGSYLDSFVVLSAYNAFNGGVDVFGQLNVSNNIVCSADIHAPYGTVYAAGNVQAANELRSGYNTWVGFNLHVNNTIYLRFDGSGGFIDCNNGYANFGQVGCRGALDVRGPTTFYVPGGNDPVTVYCDAGLYARIRYSHINVDLWSEGLTWDGQFMIADDGRAQPRMLMAPEGDISFWGMIHANNGLWVHTRELGVNNALQAFADGSGVYTYNGLTVRDGFLVATGSSEFVGYVQMDNRLNVPWGNIDCGGIVTGGSGVNVPGGKLWVNNSMEAFTSGGMGGHLVSYWKADSTFEVFGQFEAKGRVYLDGYVDCFGGLSVNNSLWLKSGSLTIENGDLQIHIGSAFKPNGGEWGNIYSSSTVKKQITDYQSGLDELCRLRPVSYQFNGLADSPNDGKTYYGILAEEALEVMPELKVGETLHRTHPEDDKAVPYAAINTSPVVWALVNAVKELAAKVEALEARGG